MTHTQPRCVLVERPSEVVILAARHLDSTEGISRPGHLLTTSDVGAINTVLRYVSKAHNSPDQAGEHPASDARPDDTEYQARELRRVEVRPGDLFVLNVKHRLSQAETDEIRDEWRARVGTHVPLMIVERGELTVFRPAAPETQP